ncbi:DUF4181 domain-containing protein [Paenibacillus campinasensis]|uniref:DUF4181 domain-containing protein n=1 Tax=Paenibacillus campinasensis TaxID=66347 RepID=A0A268ELW1_9BACL|nr:DUF4181 domain-containing protein [Paenibacillus campinasensis]PAD74094.1 hypothetical protein CHH67_18480 [Paenibacillus campinasensis]
MEVAGIFVILVFLQAALRRLLVTEKVSLFDTEGSDSYFRILVCFIAFVISMMVLDWGGIIDKALATKLWLLGGTVFLGVKRYMDKKYIPETKEHVVTTYLVSLSGIVTLWVLFL